MKTSFLGRFWLLGFFTVMAFNGHVYFLVALLRGKANADELIVNIVYSNIFDATSILLGCWVMLRLTTRIKWIPLRYILLTMYATMATLFKFQTFGWLYQFFQNTPYNNIDNSPRDWYDLLFSLGPIIGTNLVYYWFSSEHTQIIKMTEQEYQLLQMSDLKTKAELAALEAKINPHFLYNSLNSIASLVHEDPDKAEHMVLNLSKFYRFSTGRNNEHFDTLGNELAIVQTYLEVEKVRFDERLTYTVHFQHEALQQYLIPRFLIQPIVENAIKHGISKLAGNGLVAIEVSEDEHILTLAIHDNGPAFPDTILSGYGLKSIQDKMHLLLGNQAQMSIINHPRKTVVLTIPTQSHV